MKAITPEKCEELLQKNIPDKVVEAVNNLLQKKYRKGKSVILKQDDIIDEILRLNPNYTRNEIFDNGWLDFEPLFENAGWNIVYDKPAYNEIYPATFKFTAA